MIEIFKFQNLLKDLQMMFCPNRELTDFQIDEYFKVLRKYPEFILKKAIDWLMQNHKLRSLPLISEIEEAIDEVERLRSSATIEDIGTEDCSLCNNIGIIIFEKSYPDSKLTYPTAKPCSCSAGRKYEKSFRKKIKKQTRPIEEEEIPF